MKAQKSPSRSLGFTLIEVLIVVAIMAVLAVVVMTMTKRYMASAKASARLSDVRQAGVILIADASEKNGQFEYFSGGGPAGWNLRAYNIVRDALQIERNPNAEGLCGIMHWDASILPPKLLYWNCYGVNFHNVPDFGATWKQESIAFEGGSFMVKKLRFASLTRPGAYPLLMDSSIADGSEIFRIQENVDCLPGLRNNGKANAFFFDGSAKALNKAELKKAGFTKAFDNSTNPPTKITL